MHIDEAYIKKHFLAHEPESTSKRNHTSVAAQQVEKPEGPIDDPDKAFHRIELLVSVRDRSVHETMQKLQRANFSEGAIQLAIERALRCGYLDDRRFAEVFIRSRLRASKGINGIVRDLSTHKIDASEIDGFPEAFLEEAGGQLENALDLLKRKPPRAKNKKQAAYAKLVRNGFSSSVAFEAVKQWISDLEEEEVHFA